MTGDCNHVFCQGAACFMHIQGCIPKLQILAKASEVIAWKWSMVNLPKAKETKGTRRRFFNTVKETMVSRL